MAVTLIRTLIIFVALFAIMRLMGKRQIGEMQPYEFIITLIIADLACVPMSDVSIPLTYGIVSILELFLLHQLLSIIEMSGDFLKKIISGKPSVVIDKRGVNLKELKKNNMGLDDLIESMRSCGYFSLDDVDYAIFESNGKLSTLEREGEKGSSIPVLLIDNGKLKKNNVERIHLSSSIVQAILSQNNTSLKKTEVMTIDGNGKTYLKSKGQRYRSFNSTFTEQEKW